MEESTEPTPPEEVTEPVVPEEVTEPVVPEEPTEPTLPEEPIEPTPPEEPIEPDENTIHVVLETRRASALSELNDMIDEFANEVTGKIPIVERLSWGTKERVAKDIIEDNTLLVSQQEYCNVILYEAMTKGEDPLTTAAKIVENAQKYRMLVGVLTGMRRNATSLFENSTTVEQIDTILVSTVEQLDNLKKGINNGN